MARWVADGDRRTCGARMPLLACPRACASPPTSPRGTHVSLHTSLSRISVFLHTSPSGTSASLRMSLRGTSLSLCVSPCVTSTYLCVSPCGTSTSLHVPPRPSAPPRWHVCVPSRPREVCACPWSCAGGTITARIAATSPQTPGAGRTPLPWRSHPSCPTIQSDPLFHSFAMRAFSGTSSSCSWSGT